MQFFFHISTIEGIHKQLHKNVRSLTNQLRVQFLNTADFKLNELIFFQNIHSVIDQNRIKQNVKNF